MIYLLNQELDLELEEQIKQLKDKEKVTAKITREFVITVKGAS